MTHSTLSDDRPAPPQAGLRTGFIGLGNMGGRMARRLVDAGRPVLGYDARPESIEAAGATAAPSVAEVVAASDVVLLSLPESRIVEAVVLGEDGILAHARPGQVLVDLSTSAPASTIGLHGKLKAKGMTLIDAGISGGAAAAEKGTLTLMVGGDPAVLEQVRPILDAFSEHIFHCGGVGAGHTAKLLNNFLNAISLSATAEVMVAGRKAGLDLEVLLEVLNNSSGVNFATLNRFPKIIRGDYLKGGLTNSLMLKDVLAYVDLAASLGVASPNSSAPLASFGLAKQLGYAEEISNTVVDAIGDLSGGVRLHDGAPDTTDTAGANTTDRNQA
ncbi:3-hydroxyisobutyrate dehydrogenase [Arthrobacter ginkgonis]|uniref:3-hydroxyisobutyrate dehydrogenase n=1 Tax=Arthrobacter ginkgonis TaxID=1630594 RepID=A0ABP7CCE2_9MICC